jgi:hypothetical protein
MQVDRQGNECMQSILVLIGGGERDDIIIRTAHAAAVPLGAHLDFLHVRVSAPVAMRRGSLSCGSKNNDPTSFCWIFSCQSWTAMEPRAGIKADPALCSIPIVAVTSYGHGERAQFAMGAS